MAQAMQWWAVEGVLRIVQTANVLGTGLAAKRGQVALSSGDRTLF